jgi:hypothetical protein
MKKFVFPSVVLLFVAAVLVFALPQVWASANEVQRPYKAAGPEYVLQEAPHPDCAPGKLKVEVEGSGQATHLGQYTITRQHCFDIATAGISAGQFEQTAANGDKVTGTYSGSVVNVLEFAEDGSPVVVVIQSPWSITGGTGRFSDAEGEGMAIGVFNIVTKQGRFDMEGWISYTASIK